MKNKLALALLLAMLLNIGLVSTAFAMEDNMPVDDEPQSMEISIMSDDDTPW